MTVDPEISIEKAVANGGFTANGAKRSESITALRAKVETEREE